MAHFCFSGGDNPLKGGLLFEGGLAPFHTLSTTISRYLKIAKLANLRFYIRSLTVVIYIRILLSNLYNHMKVRIV